MTTQAEEEHPADSGLIAPGPSSPPAADLDSVVAATVSNVLAARKRREPTPTDRIEARADRHIRELQKYRVSLGLELKHVRGVEIPHLRSDLRWLEVRASALQSALAQLKISYEWAISFNWFSFALIAIGGVVVSYAAFLPDPPPPAGGGNPGPRWFGSQKFVATLALMALLIGVVMQAVISYRGTKALLRLPELPAEDERPLPNPGLQQGRGST